MFRRHQEGIHVGCLHPDYFMEYFGSFMEQQQQQQQQQQEEEEEEEEEFNTTENEKSCVFTTRTQYIKFNGNIVMIKCPSFVFTGFDCLPGLNCDRSFAFFNTRVTIHEVEFEKLPNGVFSGRYWLNEKHYIYENYLNRISFTCNPVTQLVKCDFEFTKIRIDEQTGERVNV